jgi:hypothetical protein
VLFPSIGGLYLAVNELPSVFLISISIPLLINSFNSAFPPLSLAILALSALFNFKASWISSTFFCYSLILLAKFSLAFSEVPIYACLSFFISSSNCFFCSYNSLMVFLRLEEAFFF